MLRKTMIALFAIAAAGMLVPSAASARGGYHGSFGGSYRGAAIGGITGFRAAAIGSGVGRSAVIGGSGFRGPAFAARGFHHGFHHRRVFVFGAFAGPYAYFDDYNPYYVYDDTYYDDGGCYIVRQRVHTRHGWRVRPVQVCG
jgi:hypothetical protein